MKKRCLFTISAILLVSILTSLLCCFPVSAASVTEISTADQLKAVKDNLAGSYRLTADIDLGGEEWEPLGDEATPFTGTFDGNGKTVSNFTVTADEDYGKNHAGFFGTVSTGTIKDLKIATATITTSYSIYAGAIAGHLSSHEGGLVSGCVTASDVTVIANGNFANWIAIGGIVGRSFGTVQYCENNATVKNESCHRLPTDEDPTTTQLAFTGGICGGAVGTVKYCINNGNVITEDYEGKKGAWLCSTGGIIGQTNPWMHEGNGLRCLVDSCINNGTVSNKFENLNLSSCAGGIVGVTYGGNSDINARTIKNCFNFGAIDCMNAGQILGHKGTGIEGQLGAFTSDNNYGIANLAPMCYNVENSLLTVVGTPETAANMKANTTYLAILAAVEENMIFELSEMPAPAVAPETPPSDTTTDNTDDDGEDEEEEEVKKKSDKTTDTSADTTAETEAEEEGGCKSSISLAGVALVTALGIGVTACKKKN